MKILLCSYNTIFFQLGGGEIQFRETYEQLHAKGLNVEIHSNYKIYEREEISLVHIFSVCNSVENFANQCIGNRIPYVISPIHWPVEDEIDRVEYSRIRHILSNAEAWLVNSEEEMSKLELFYGLRATVSSAVIVNGISEKFLEMAGSYDRRRGIGRKKVLTIANIDKRKNLVRLAKACSVLRMDLTIVGGIRDVSESKLIKQEYPDARIVGPLSHDSEEFLETMNSHDIFALPSFYETPGLAALEAAVFGMPLVVTEVGGTKSYFGDNADYCDPYSVQSIANALEKRKSEIDHRRAAAEIAARCRWSKAADATADVYKQVMR